MMFDESKPHKRGDELSPNARAQALASYVYRFTRDHVPAWARKPMPNGSAYPVQFASDTEWLANTLFNVSRHRVKNDCYSRPTWPDNPELRRAP